MSLIQDTNYTLDANSALEWDVSGIDVVVNLGVTTGFRVYVTGIAGSLPGDADDNGVVNAADYIILKRNMGQPATAGPADGDFNGDGTVNYADLVLLQDNYGKSSAGAPTIPEPATLGLLAVGALAVIRRRRRA